MTTKTPELSPEILRPYIASRSERVGNRRTDLADVARILVDGAYCAAAHNMIEDRVAANHATVAVDRSAIGRLSAAYEEAEAFGTGATGLDGYSRFAHSASSEVLRNGLGRELDAAMQPITDRSASIEIAVRGWYATNDAAIQRIAREEAANLLRQRGHITTRTYADLFGGE